MIMIKIMTDTMREKRKRGKRGEEMIQYSKHIQRGGEGGSEEDI